jgi:hypothetical protein
MPHYEAKPLTLQGLVVKVTEELLRMERLCAEGNYGAEVQIYLPIPAGHPVIGAAIVEAMYAVGDADAPGSAAWIAKRTGDYMVGRHLDAADALTFLRVISSRFEGYLAANNLSLFSAADLSAASELGLNLG